MRGTDLIYTVFRVTEKEREALLRLGLRTVRDLLYHFPSRYGDVSAMRTIDSLRAGELAVVFGNVVQLEAKKAFYKKIPMATGTIEDDTGKIKVVWYNQPYIAKMYPADTLVRLEGKVAERKKELYFSNPKVERVQKMPTGVGDSLFGESGQAHHLYPVYPESSGVTSNWIFHATQKALKNGALETLTESIPTDILKKYNLPSLPTALIWIHAPRTEGDARAARKRFSFEEIFFIQLEKQKARKQFAEQPAYSVPLGTRAIKTVTERLPYALTGAQERAIEAIVADMEKPSPMARLLEGDVGSGKTIVAAAAARAVVATRPPDSRAGCLQVAYMAPTEILAAQHFKSFIEFFRHLPVPIGLITSSGCKKFPAKSVRGEATEISRSQLLRWVGNGEIPILIGTHSLIQSTVRFKHLALVIIDEQHRFGTRARQKLVTKYRGSAGRIPHLLTMSATPIPRTLALTLFGDLDLSVLDELPPGRKPVLTKVVMKTERDAAYEHLRAEIQSGRQAYIICPRIDEPDPQKELALEARSVKAEAKRLAEKIFPEFAVGILHGKQKPKEKEKVMAEFAAGTMNILVATSVVEVGVNVPNATIILIEGSERFGLAQLHQLRGRVMRSTHQPYCYIFAESFGEKARSRLSAFVKAKDGFELAEHDLAFRGAGELSGGKQWGVSDIAMEALQNMKMVEAARTEAARIIAEDPSLALHPDLQKSIAARTAIHFE